MRAQHRGQRLAEGAHAAADVAEAAEVVADASGQVVGLGVGRPGGRRAHERAHGAAEGQHALDPLGLEVGLDEVAGRPEDEAQEEPLVVGAPELGREVSPAPVLSRHQEVFPEDRPDPRA